MSGNSNSGRRPKPTALKLLEGNRGRHPLNLHEPRSAPVSPPTPDGLDDDEVAEWNYVIGELARMGTLGHSDQYVIRSLVDAVCDYRRYRTFIKANGATYEALYVHEADQKSGQPEWLKTTWKKRPETDLMSKARADIYRFATLLGLDPSSRSRLKADPGDSGDGPQLNA